jgi:hypothetical protein
MLRGLHHSNPSFVGQSDSIVLDIAEAGVIESTEGGAQLACGITPAPDETLGKGTQQGMREVELLPACHRPAELTHEQCLNAEHLGFDGFLERRGECLELCLNLRRCSGWEFGHRLARFEIAKAEFEFRRFR